MFVPESDTGRPPENGKVIERTLVKELGNLASYVSNKRYPRGRKALLGSQ